jgi:hypothetical protein
VGGRGHGAAGALLPPDGPELLECGGAHDGRLVDARGRVDVVRAAVRRDVALERPRLVRREVRVVLDDVVLDQRVRRPAVDGQVARARGVVGAGERDAPVAVWGTRSDQRPYSSRMYT